MLSSSFLAGGPAPTASLCPAAAACAPCIPCLDSQVFPRDFLMVTQTSHCPLATLCHTIDNQHSSLSSVDDWRHNAMNITFLRLPRILVESAASGVSLIASNIGGCADVVHHKVNGFLINQNSLEELIDSLEKLIINNELSTVLTLKTDN